MATEKSAVAIAQPNRQVVTVFLHIGGGGVGSSDEKGVDRKLNLAFNPKEVVLRQLTWAGTAAADVLSTIRSNMHKDMILATFPGSSDGCVTPCSSFNLQSRPDSVRFWVTDFNTDNPSSYNGGIALTMEFRG